MNPNTLHVANFLKCLFFVLGYHKRYPVLNHRLTISRMTQSPNLYQKPWLPIFFATSVVSSILFLLWPLTAGILTQLPYTPYPGFNLSRDVKRIPSCFGCSNLYYISRQGPAIHSLIRLDRCDRWSGRSYLYLFAILSCIHFRGRDNLEGILDRYCCPLNRPDRS